MKQIIETAFGQRRGDRCFTVAEAELLAVHVRMGRLGRRLGRMRLDGHDPVRLLLVEPRQIQPYLKRPQVHAFQRDGVRRDIDFRIVDCDAVELVVGGDEFRIQVGELRQLCPTAQL